jgi:hypothetical protein
MRNVENSGGTADGEMFVGDAGILDGHFPAAEINQFGTELLVGGKQWSAFQHNCLSPRNTFSGGDKR